MLPNGCEGFLRSNKNYSEGEYRNVVAKVFFDLEKAQSFTDKIVSHTIFALEQKKGKVVFSKKISRSFNKKEVLDLLIKSWEFIKISLSFAVQVLLFLVRLKLKNK